MTPTLSLDTVPETARFGQRLTITGRLAVDTIPGADIEVDRARDQGLTVFDSVDAVPTVQSPSDTPPHPRTD